MRPLCLCATLIVAGCMAGHAQEPVLETYAIRHGGNQTSPKPSEVDAVISDKFLGNGTARAQIKLESNDTAQSLSLLVVRSVQAGETVFALLVARVEVRAYDSAGNEVYQRFLNGFVFGDSQPGVWLSELDDIPTGAQEIRVTFWGNYE